MNEGCIHRFIVNSIEYGIEDYEDGQPDEVHFFPKERRQNKEPRFRLWRQGNSFGTAETLEQARKLLGWRVDQELKGQQKMFTKLLQDADTALANFHSEGLDYFQTEHT